MGVGDLDRTERSCGGTVVVEVHELVTARPARQPGRVLLGHPLYEHLLGTTDGSEVVPVGDVLLERDQPVETFLYDHLG